MKGGRKALGVPCSLVGSKDQTPVRWNFSHEGAEIALALTDGGQEDLGKSKKSQHKNPDRDVQVQDDREIRDVSALLMPTAIKSKEKYFPAGVGVWEMPRYLPLKLIFPSFSPRQSRNPSEISALKVKLESFHPQPCKLFLKSVTLKIIH